MNFIHITTGIYKKYKSSNKPKKKGKARGHPSPPETGPRRFVCTKG